MIFGLKAKAAVAAVVVAGAFGAGWTSKGWLEDSKDLAAMEAQEALAEKIREGQAKISKQVEQRLSELRANERIIDRGVIREIQKPVYQRVCLEPGAIRLLNSVANGQAPGKPDGKSSNDAPESD